MLPESKRGRACIPSIHVCMFVCACMCVTWEGMREGKYGLCIVSTSSNWSNDISDTQHLNKKALESCCQKMETALLKIKNLV